LGTIARIFRGRIARQVSVMVAVMLALLLRVGLTEQSITLPTYVTFYPVVFLAAVLGGIWEGILATTLSALMTDYFLLEPLGQFTVHSTSDTVGLVIFCTSGIFVSIVTGLFHRSIERRAAYKIEAAVLNESGKVEEAGELAETVSAERLRFFDLFESLRGKKRSTVSSEAVPIRNFSATGHESRLPALDQPRFRALLRWTVAVPFMATLILAGAVLWAAYDLNDTMQLVEHTDRVVGQSRRLLRLVVDMETGERGYLVTGNDTFLQPYQEASKAIDSEYRKLYLLVADNPPQQTLLERLQGNLLHWQSYAEHMIALRRAGGAYSDLSINLVGKGEVDEIRDQLAGFQSVEEHLREKRSSTAHRDWRIVLTICIALGLGVGTVLAAFTRRRMGLIAASFEESGRALAEGERRWVTTLASIGDAVMAADREGRVTFLNPVAASITGWQPEDALGQPIQNVFNIVNEQTRLPEEDIVKRVLKGGLVFERANHTALLANDGREILIADSVAPILEEDGAIVGVVLVFHDITERKQAEETRARLAAIIESSRDAIISKDLDGTVLSWNESAERIFEYSAEEIVGQPITLIVPPDRHAEEAEIIERLRQGDHIDHFETIRVRKGGGHVDVSETISPVCDAAGAVFGISTIVRDITARKQMEDALRRQASLIDLTPDAFTIRHLDGTFTYWNRGAEALYGWSKDEAVGQRSHSLFQTKFPQDLKEIDGQLRRTGSWSGELIQRAKDGREVVVQSRWLAQYDTHGEVAEVLESNADITARKQAEQQLRELNEELEDRVHQRTAELEAALVDRLQSEQRFVTLANFVPQLVWICTPDGLNVYFNQRWVKYTGLTLEESYGKGWNSPFHPDDRQTAWEAWSHASQTGENYRVESRLRAADGSYRWFLMLGEALRDAEGNVVQWFGTCTDIADLKQAEEALRESQRGLEDVNKELQSFSYSVSHDLRGPLRTMDGFSQALLEDHSQHLDEKGKHYVGRIRTAAQRMGRLIDDLLQLSRLTRMEMRVKPVDLSTMALAVIGELRESEPGRIVEVLIEPGLETRGDPGLLQVALQNLLSNAWKFTSRRERAVIEFGRVNDQPDSAFFVRDNGAGFDMQYADHLFSPFQRLHAEEEFKGTGIGLATVQRIIRRHSGRIWAEAAEEQGATFYFQLGF
jgi:PAS domain S-box-containing protein